MEETIKVNEQLKPALKPLCVPKRLLLGPGPSGSYPEVLRAMGSPAVGYLDPAFIEVMQEIQALLRYVWQTTNETTICISGTGSAAMEACVANTVERNDVVLVAVCGYFGNRLVDMAERYGADVRVINKPWGQVFTCQEIREALEKHRPRVLAMVHVETSTGVVQPMEGIGALCREYDSLLLLDTVTSLGGVPIHLDAWGVDLAYSCSQKGLSASPGASPLTVGPRALEKMRARRGKVANWYLDLTLLEKYWGPARQYHHTASMACYYGLREALRVIAEEGMSACWQRHAENAEYLWSELEKLGLTMHVEKPWRAPTLTTVRIPDGIDGKALAKKLLEEEQIEIGNGIGDLAGKVWRVGLMGYNSRRETVDKFIAAFAKVLD
ncbi:alanine-glyoxylate aminotransferase [Besnoitia besnoiti]|uniref:alanine--glyoxylate transaminase n=1 Tax=Besnoitia besnoiti TaxID=94643 RepID=A0A2A9MBP4_BESBE|nr:alanine-glyoxylate aminotransferase [Besnoitia besnoiti]PFH33037.1 alanine-glyoxylate aminotransferase [Besnoitia besnoiti]